MGQTLNIKNQASLYVTHPPSSVGEAFQFFGKLILRCQQLLSLHLKQIWKIATSTENNLELDSGGDVGDEDDNEPDEEEDEVFENHNEDKLWQEGLGFKFSRVITFSPMMSQYSTVKGYSQLEQKS